MRIWGWHSIELYKMSRGWKTRLDMQEICWELPATNHNISYSALKLSDPERVGDRQLNKQEENLNDTWPSLFQMTRADLTICYLFRIRGLRLFRCFRDPSVCTTLSRAQVVIRGCRFVHLAYVTAGGCLCFFCCYQLTSYVALWIATLLRSSSGTEFEGE